MRAGRLKRKLKIGIVLIAAIAVLIVGLWPRERLLLQHATPVVHLGKDGGYCWLTDQKLLIVSSDNANPSLCHVAILDLTAATRIACPALETLINSTGGGGIQLSPDRKSLLWYGNKGIYCADVNGRLLAKTLRTDWPNTADWPNTVEWLTGGQQWIEYAQAARYRSDMTVIDPVPLQNLYLHSLNAPGQTHVIPVSPPTELNTGDFVAVVDKRMLLFRSEVSGDEPIVMDRYRIGSSITLGERCRLASPRRNIDLSGDYALSASGRHICMAVMDGAPASPILKWLHDRIPIVRAEDLGRFALFTSSTKTIVLHDLGVTPPQDLWTLQEFPPITQLAFTPDEKRISFVYHDVLYTVPVD